MSSSIHQIARSVKRSPRKRPKAGSLPPLLASAGMRTEQGIADVVFAIHPRLWAWGSMSGSVVVLEALLREQDHVMDAGELDCAIFSAGQLLKIAAPMSRSAIMSLMSTVCKHTAMCTVRLMKQTRLGEAGETASSAFTGCTAVTKCLANLVHILEETLVCGDSASQVCWGQHESSSTDVRCKHQAVVNNSTDFQLKPAVEQASSSSSNSGKVMERSKKKDESISTNNCSTSDLHCMDQSMPTVLQSTGCSDPLSQELPVQRSDNAGFVIHKQHLQALLVLMVTQLEGMTLGVQADQEESVKPMLDSSITQLLNLPLQNIIKLVSAAPQDPSYSRKACRFIVASVWDSHILVNYNGRLLSGCSHLGCKNMWGRSEAALPTLLCGGCRKVRYCSMECQRAAWLFCGHKVTCKWEDLEAGAQWL